LAESQFFIDKIEKIFIIGVKRTLKRGSFLKGQKFFKKI